MKIADLNLKPGDRVLELKSIVVQRATGETESHTVSEVLIPQEPKAKAKPKAAPKK